MDSGKDGKWKKICPAVHRQTDLPKTKKPLISKSKQSYWMQGEKNDNLWNPRTTVR